MALSVRVTGPGVDEERTLEAGSPELVLGRDSECGICLPDPMRNVSRRHLAVWNVEGELHFRVLSVVNGVEMPFGEAPPGAKGVLALGQVLKLAEYSLVAQAVQGQEAPAAPAQEAAGDDPWAVFDRESPGVAPETQPLQAAAAHEDDPFGEWGFENTFGPAGGGGALDASKLGAAADLAPFFFGLGVDPAKIGSLSQGEMEAVGRLARAAVLGAVELHRSAAGVKQEMHAEDRTMVGTKDNNPLKADWPEETVLQYLFGGRASSVGFINPEKALHALLAELLAHESAVASAARAAVDGTVREFSPEALKKRLLGDGTRLFESTRAWDAFCKYYEQQAAAQPAWAQRLLDKYFADTYLRETARIRRETTRKPG